MALVSGDDTLADDRLPEDDGRAVEEEGQHPYCQHLEHSLAGRNKRLERATFERHDREDTKKKRRHQLTHEEIRYSKVQKEVVALISQGFIHNKSHDDQRVPSHHNDNQSHHEHR
ncbi:hypothetical protein F7725_027657 [Dissostichus mawsoni]|uniref:Uncharacterized protein n=1 Tax=Dissostichus mawsoni TaxID=36200 RepID=A0A7J5XEF9_DISMA|nr:hypothetical protein F7725_027657 [Dissostichus mawsoni]